jgi:hypothetical protein
MRFFLFLFIFTVSIPYSAALAQNSQENSRLFIGKQNSKPCVGCAKKLYNGGNDAGSTPRPLNIKGMLRDQEAQNQGMQYKRISRQQPKQTYSLGGNSKGDKTKTRLQQLAAETSRKEMENAITRSKEREARVRAMQARIMEQQQYYQDRARKEEERAWAEYNMSRNDTATRTSALTGTQRQRQPTQKKRVYKGNSSKDANRPGTRVFLSPR